MKTNKVVADVRKARKEISNRYGNDLKKLVSHYKMLERKTGCRVRGEESFRKAV
jgi:hypothetical protein